jgi:hypothetical protein
MPSGCYEVSLNDYFFFFLAAFFAFAFFAFLAMLASVIPKVGSMHKSTIDVHTFRLHHDCKIDTFRFEEGKRRSHRCDLRRGDAPA